MLLRPNEYGLYCEIGDFYIDPWRPVKRAIITHGHSDHSRWGHKHYLATGLSEGIMRRRLGDINLQTMPYGHSKTIKGVKVSFHPAGHLLGSAQVRVEHKGEVWVVTGDYKLGKDKTCAEFEPVKCNTFITESTFGLPIYRWKPEAELETEMNEWWKKNAEQGKTSLIYAYSLGKAQRVISCLDPSIGTIYTHGSVEKMNDAYREKGVDLPPTKYLLSEDNKENYKTGIVIAPPSFDNAASLRRFKQKARAFASGWMQIRGNRRRRGIEKGFVMSDHADWPGLISAIEATGAENIMVTHGYTQVLSKWLTEQGYNAVPLETQYQGTEDEDNDEESQLAKSNPMSIIKPKTSLDTDKGDTNPEETE
ncbi:MAG: ligase-associated DNA damage response exonuclease [Candidatus Kapaibacteriales bacterium]